jgi:hypothetical protein
MLIGCLEKTSFITFKQSCSRGLKSTGNRGLGLDSWQLQLDVQVFTQRTLVFDHPRVSQPIISPIFHECQDRVGSLDSEFLP